MVACLLLHSMLHVLHSLLWLLQRSPKGSYFLQVLQSFPNTYASMCLLLHSMLQALYSHYNDYCKDTQISFKFCNAFLISTLISMSAAALHATNCTFHNTMVTSKKAKTIIFPSSFANFPNIYASMSAIALHARTTMTIARKPETIICPLCFEQVFLISMLACLPLRTHSTCRALLPHAPALKILSQSWNPDDAVMFFRHTDMNFTYF